MSPLTSSPRVLSRIGGILYLMIIVGGAYGEMFLRGRLIVPGDATATAANMTSMESLWRIGVASEVFMLVCALVLTWILFLLLRPVSRELALLAVFFTLVTLAVEAINELQLLAALFPLGSAGYLGAFAPEQLHAMASLSLKAYSYGFGFALIFFGCSLIVFGYLVSRSRYLPRTIGVLMQIGGVSYLLNSFALILSPAVAARLFPFILLPAFVGEVSLCLWLLLKGVDMEKWDARARSQAAGSPGNTVGA